MVQQISIRLAIHRYQFDLRGHRVFLDVRGEPEQRVLQNALVNALQTVRIYDDPSLTAEKDLSLLENPYLLGVDFNEQGRILDNAQKLLTFDRITYDLARSLLEGLVNPKRVRGIGFTIQFSYTFKGGRLEGVQVTYGDQVSLPELVSLAIAWGGAKLTIVNNTPAIVRDNRFAVAPVAMDTTIARVNDVLADEHAILTARRGCLDIQLSSHLHANFHEQALLGIFTTFERMVWVSWRLA